jgi:uncharacterized protein (TIGR03083 family)
MVDDSDLAGLDPYDLMEVETARIDAYLGNVDNADPLWNSPSRCDGWTVRDVLAHLAATEDYHRACLDGRVQEFFAEVVAKGGKDLATANNVGIREFDGQTPEQILATWRTKATQNRSEFRERDGKDVDTSIGSYPARWQAFHLAFELAVHADDVGVPVHADEVEDRVDWQAHHGRFALKEAKPDLGVEEVDGRTRVRGQGIDIELSDDEFVQAVAARLSEASRIDEKAAAVLSVTP